MTSTILVCGVFDGFNEREFTNQRTGKPEKVVSAIFIVDLSNRKRDAVFVRIPEDMDVPKFEKGTVYTIPVSLYSKERISFTARPDLQPR